MSDLIGALLGGTLQGAGAALPQLPAQRQQRLEQEIKAKRDIRKARLDSLKDLKNLQEADPNSPEFPILREVAIGSAGEGPVNTILQQMLSPGFISREQAQLAQRATGAAATQGRQEAADIRRIAAASPATKEIKLLETAFNKIQTDIRDVEQNLAEGKVFNLKSAETFITNNRAQADKFADLIVARGGVDPRVGRLIPDEPAVKDVLLVEPVTGEAIGPTTGPAALDTSVVAPTPAEVSPTPAEVSPGDLNTQLEALSAELGFGAEPTDEQLDAIIAEAQKRGIL